MIMALYQRDCIEFIRQANVNTNKAFEWQAVFKYELAEGKEKHMFLSALSYKVHFGYHWISDNALIPLIPRVL